MVKIEMLSAAHYSRKDIKIIDEALQQFFIHPYNDYLEETVIKLRRTTKLKIPDAFIAATALELRLPLFSNDRIFDKVQGLNFIYVEF